MANSVNRNARTDRATYKRAVGIRRCPRWNAKLAAAIAMTLAAPAGISVASAQQAGASATGGLEEIVVTARKREESLQDIPLAVSALSPEELARRPDVDLSSFANASPNVIIDDMQEGPGSAAAMTIRGIGTNDHERSIDPTVGVVVDGVFIGSVGGAMVKALDLQSVEILRGPQGTLFAAQLDRRCRQHRASQAGQ